MDPCGLISNKDDDDKPRMQTENVFILRHFLHCP